MNNIDTIKNALSGNTKSWIEWKSSNPDWDSQIQNALLYSHVNYYTVLHNLTKINDFLNSPILKPDFENFLGFQSKHLYGDAGNITVSHILLFIIKKIQWQQILSGNNIDVFKLVKDAKYNQLIRDIYKQELFFFTIEEKNKFSRKENDEFVSKYVKLLLKNLNTAKYNPHNMCHLFKNIDSYSIKINGNNRNFLFDVVLNLPNNALRHWCVLYLMDKNSDFKEFADTYYPDSQKYIDELNAFKKYTDSLSLIGVEIQYKNLFNMDEDIKELSKYNNFFEKPNEKIIQIELN